MTTIENEKPATAAAALAAAAGNPSFPLSVDPILSPPSVTVTLASSQLVTPNESPRSAASTAPPSVAATPSTTLSTLSIASSPSTSTDRSTGLGITGLSNSHSHSYGQRIPAFDSPLPSDVRKLQSSAANKRVPKRIPLLTPAAYQQLQMVEQQQQQQQQTREKPTPNPIPVQNVSGDSMKVESDNVQQHAQRLFHKPSSPGATDESSPHLYSSQSATAFSSSSSTSTSLSPSSSSANLSFPAQVFPACELCRQTFKSWSGGGGIVGPVYRNRNSHAQKPNSHNHAHTTPTATATQLVPTLSPASSPSNALSSSSTSAALLASAVPSTTSGSSSSSSASSPSPASGTGFSPFSHADVLYVHFECALWTQPFRYAAEAEESSTASSASSPSASAAAAAASSSASTPSSAISVDESALLEACNHERLSQNACALCGVSHASIPCSAPRCVRYFHYPCARQSQCFLCDHHFRIYCPSHRHVGERDCKLSHPLTAYHPQNDRTKQKKINNEQVERILSVRRMRDRKRRHRFYLVHWKGQTQADATWEPEDNFANKTLLYQFCGNLRKKSTKYKAASAAGVLDDDPTGSISARGLEVQSEQSSPHGVQTSHAFGLSSQMVLETHMREESRSRKHRRDSNESSAESSPRASPHSRSSDRFERLTLPVNLHFEQDPLSARSSPLSAASISFNAISSSSSSSSASTSFATNAPFSSSSLSLPSSLRASRRNSFSSDEMLSSTLSAQSIGRSPREIEFPNISPSMIASGRLAASVNLKSRNLVSPHYLDPYAATVVEQRRMNMPPPLLASYSSPNEGANLSHAHGQRRRSLQHEEDEMVSTALAGPGSVAASGGGGMMMANIPMASSPSSAYHGTIIAPTSISAPGSRALSMPAAFASAAAAAHSPPPQHAHAYASAAPNPYYQYGYPAAPAASFYASSPYLYDSSGGMAVGAPQWPLPLPLQVPVPVSVPARHGMVPQMAQMGHAAYYQHPSATSMVMRPIHTHTPASAAAAVPSGYYAPPHNVPLATMSANPQHASSMMHAMQVQGPMIMLHGASHGDNSHDDRHVHSGTLEDDATAMQRQPPSSSAAIAPTASSSSSMDEELPLSAS